MTWIHRAYVRFCHRLNVLKLQEAAQADGWDFFKCKYKKNQVPIQLIHKFINRLPSEDQTQNYATRCIDIIREIHEIKAETYDSEHEFRLYKLLNNKATSALQWRESPLGPIPYIPFKLGSETQLDEMIESISVGPSMDKERSLAAAKLLARSKGINGSVTPCSRNFRKM